MQDGPHKCPIESVASPTDLTLNVSCLESIVQAEKAKKGKKGCYDCVRIWLSMEMLVPKRG